MIDKKNIILNREISKTHLFAVLQALFVTVLWSSSWIIIKFGLEEEEIPPLFFSGLRYFIASLILFFIVFRNSNNRKEITNLSRNKISILAMYGIIFIFFTQGAMFIALEKLPAITVSMLLNLTPLIVLIISIFTIKEIPTRIEILLILLSIFGVLIYFYPIDIPLEEFLGLTVLMIGVFCNALSSIFGRIINKEKLSSPIIVTVISMLIGSTLLLIVSVIIENIPPISLLSAFLIVYLSLINTAFAFTLWNKTMQHLRAIDTSVINSTMLPQITILSVLFLNERPTELDWIGLIIMAVSVFIIQVLQATRNSKSKEE